MEVEAETNAKCTIHDIPKSEFDRQIFKVENLWTYPTRPCGAVLTEGEYEDLMEATEAGDNTFEIFAMETFENEVKKPEVKEIKETVSETKSETKSSLTFGE